MREWLAAMCLLSACSDDGGTGPGNGCGFAITLSGAATASFTTSDAFTCSAAANSSGDPIIVFYPEHETLMRFDIDFPSESANMTGPNIEGDFTVVSTSGFTWAADCTYDIARWEGTGGQQHIQGTGTCDPLEPETGNQTITVTDLAFDTF